MRAIAASSAGQPVGPLDRLAGAGAGDGAGRGAGFGVVLLGGAGVLVPPGRVAGGAFFVVLEEAMAVGRAGRRPVDAADAGRCARVDVERGRTRSFSAEEAVGVRLTSGGRLGLAAVRTAGEVSVPPAADEAHMMATAAPVRPTTSILDAMVPPPARRPRALPRERDEGATSPGP